ncbi:MAG: patatin-like phospholipase family protein [Acidobacteriota bacterium]
MRGVAWIVGLAAALLAWVAWAQRSNPFSAEQWAAVTAGVLLAAWLALFQLRRPAVQYLVLCRYPLIAGGLLATFPVLAVTAARPMLGNLFSLRGFGFGVVSFLAFFLAWVVLVTLRLIAQLAPERFGVEPFDLPARLRFPLESRRGFALALLLALPTVLVAWRASAIGAGWKILAAGTGIAAAAWLIWLSLFLRERLAAWVPVRLRPWISSHICRGYVYQDGEGRPRFHPGHLFNALLVLVTGLVYVTFFLAQTPGDESFGLFPALVYTMLLMILGTFVLSAAAFFLDRYRVPTLLLVAAASFFSFFITDSDHYYRTRPARDEAPLDPATAFRTWYQAREAREARTGADGSPPVVVAVSAVGGGITTGLWTDHVLARLEKEVGEGLISSIALVSGVSGGSVGTLHFMDALARPDGTTLRSRLERAREDVAKPSLPEAVWGLVYPDFWRTLPGPWFRWKSVEDRGEALERAWSRRLRNPEATLADWREEIRAGRLPVPVFNTTITETGGRLLITPVDLRPDWGAYGFSQLYPELDIRAVTAARLSAAFPYVSPIARPRLEDPRDRRSYHLADGGYYDNFGVASLVDWLRTVLPEVRELGGRRILLVQIRDAPRRDEGAGSRTGWTVSALGPLKTLMTIRTASQAARNELEADLFQRLACRQGVQVESFLFTLAPGRGSEEEALPLSWQLTDGERQRIEDRWLTPANQVELCRARICFETPDDGVCAAARRFCEKKDPELPPAGSFRPCPPP